MAQFSPAKSTVSAQNLMEFMDKPIHTLTMKRYTRNRSGNSGKVKFRWYKICTATHC